LRLGLIKALGAAKKKGFMVKIAEIPFGTTDWSKIEMAGASTSLADCKLRSARMDKGGWTWTLVSVPAWDQPSMDHSEAMAVWREIAAY
jgi:hypothetical protein